MSKQTHKVISESTHECGQIISSVTCLVTDAHLAVKPDPPFDFERPFCVVAGPYTPPPQYKARFELSGYCESMTVTNTEDICPKCGMDVPLLSGTQPTPKHDGKLDEGKGVGYYTLFKENDRVNIENDVFDGISLTPKQALSLLAWLRQEEATLERLAKEQVE